MTDGAVSAGSNVLEVEHAFTQQRIAGVAESFTEGGDHGRDRCAGAGATANALRHLFGKRRVAQHAQMRLQEPGFEAIRSALVARELFDERSDGVIEARLFDVGAAAGLRQQLRRHRQTRHCHDPAPTEAPAGHRPA